MEKIVFAGGCFWCTEAVFQRLNGVLKVTSGYANGEGSNPSYEEVSLGNTGFAEAIEVEFDTNIISLEKLLEIFWATHDPTTLNKQGYDEGAQYRSAIFYLDEDQKSVAMQSKEEQMNHESIVTKIEPLKNFYTAEEYHQNYYNSNQESNQYCSLVINPKIKKLLEKFSAEVKSEYK